MPRLEWTHYMQLALEQAHLAAQSGEVPVGALLLDHESGQIISMSGNRSVASCDPSAHAEICVLREAGRIRQNYRLPGTVLVTTLEPCLMCVGALIQARISGLVFAARDPVAGAVISCLDIFELNQLNHSFWFIDGILEHQASDLLSSFFQARRPGR
ncbi:MAG: nucleoside deaminase [Desulfonatronovibrionaceae bacterium]